MEGRSNKQVIESAGFEAQLDWAEMTEREGVSVVESSSKISNVGDWDGN